MGCGLPKAVEAIAVERHGGECYRMGLAEMNGWRPAMEDAHVAVMRDGWGFFGVFDGHGGAQCAEFVARRLKEELSVGPPPVDDAAMKELMLRIDREFLATRSPSGSTGTFMLVEPAATAGRRRLRVGNIGDSRVLLGRRCGSLVEGCGSDGALTTDHKPDCAAERERVERTGGTVQFIQGVPRVNGDLAVSRAFGDAAHKETGGPKQEDHPVSAEPEFTTIECDETDFVVLVCDGISEGNFPNREVVQVASQMLAESSEGGLEPDLGLVAAGVCRRALCRGSCDNLSCMIVQFRGGEAAGPARELLPGPIASMGHPEFRRAYATMAQRAGITLAKAVEQRWDDARRSVAAADAGGRPDDACLREMRAELALLPVPPPDLAGDQRTAWFGSWVAEFARPPRTAMFADMVEVELTNLAKRLPIHSDELGSLGSGALGLQADDALEARDEARDVRREAPPQGGADGDAAEGLRRCDESTAAPRMEDDTSEVCAGDGPTSAPQKEEGFSEEGGQRAGSGDEAGEEQQPQQPPAPAPTMASAAPGSSQQDRPSPSLRRASPEQEVAPDAKRRRTQ